MTEPLDHLLETLRRATESGDYSLRARAQDGAHGAVAEAVNALLAQVEAGQERLRVARDKAEAASRAKSGFLANMSHELRTPLNAIIGFSEVIKTELLGPLRSDRYRFYAQDIYDSGQHLLAVINDILDLSKVEAGAFELDETAADLRQLLEPPVRLLRERAAAAGLEFVVEIAAEPLAVVVDRRLIKQSLINLLSNALKFTAAPGRITLSAGLGEDRSLVIAVSDTGIGIGVEDIPRVLRPFGQAAPAGAQRHQGTGLGLPLARSFLELHGGALELESRPGAGTTVRLRLPAERVVLCPRRPPLATGGAREADAR